MGQGSALKSLDRMETKKRKKLTLEKLKTNNNKKTRQRRGWERGEQKQEAQGTWNQRGTNSSGADRTVSSGDTAFQACYCTLETSFSLQCLK